MDLYEAMSTQRAVRRLRPDPIPDDVMQRIKEASTWAPTGGNVQPWRMVMVQSEAAKTRLRDLYAPLWANYTSAGRERLETAWKADLSAMERTIKAGDHLAENMGKIPAIAVFCFNPTIMAITDSEQPRPSVVGGGSVYTAVQNLMLACRAEGVGCVLTTLLCMEEPAVRELLQLPDDWYTCAHVPMGYPVATGYGSINRRPVNKMIYTDVWGED